jgi:hypothetical protein
MFKKYLVDVINFDWLSNLFILFKAIIKFTFYLEN